MHPGWLGRVWQPRLHWQTGCRPEKHDAFMQAKSAIGFRRVRFVPRVPWDEAGSPRAAKNLCGNRNK
jgi:hypothetical protein